MSRFKQLISPRLDIKVGAGWCLMHTRMVFGAPAVESSAWDAWLNARGRHFGAPPTDVSVPVFFSHWGVYGVPAEYKNWGHVVTSVPGVGYLSSPGSGYGAVWFPTISAVENYFGAKYVGWATHISGVEVVRPQNEDSSSDEDRQSKVRRTRQLRERENMLFIKLDSQKNQQGQAHAVFVLGQKGSWLEFSGKGIGAKFEKQLGPAVPVSDSQWKNWKGRH